MLSDAITVTSGNPPVLIKISPGTMNTGNTPSFMLTGFRFQEGAMVVLSNASYGMLVADITSVTARKITGTISIPEGSSTGMWSVSVTNPDGGTATLPDAVMITTPSGDDGSGPTVISVKPMSGSAGKTVGIVIKGEDFTKGSSVALFSDSITIPAYRQSTINSMKMFVVFRIPADASPGSYDLVVTDNEGISGTLPGGFTVLRTSTSL